MSDATSQFWLWLILIFSIFIPSSSADQKTITAEPGQNVTLPCRAPNNNNIIVVEWSRADLQAEYVFVYRNERFDPENQHPSFKNRVDLQDKQMKDGDVSVILKDVTVNDTETYECRVQRDGDSSMQLINTTTLRVVAPPGQPGGLRGDRGSAGLIVGLSVFAGLVGLVLVGGVSGFFIYKRCIKRQGPDPKQLPEEHQLDCESRDSHDRDLQTYEENLLMKVP